jgi:hypothetical protein
MIHPGKNSFISNNTMYIKYRKKSLFFTQSIDKRVFTKYIQLERFFPSKLGLSLHYLLFPRRQAGVPFLGYFDCASLNFHDVSG